MDPLQPPSAGQLAEVRRRRFVVKQVAEYELEREPGHLFPPPPQHRVDLASIDDEPRPELPEVVVAVHGGNSRQRRLFGEFEIGVAYDRLVEHGWI